jgi:hypothetical protein
VLDIKGNKLESGHTLVTPHIEEFNVHYFNYTELVSWGLQAADVMFHSYSYFPPLSHEWGTSNQFLLCYVETHPDDPQ